MKPGRTSLFHGRHGVAIGVFPGEKKRGHFAYYMKPVSPDSLGNRPDSRHSRYVVLLRALLARGATHVSTGLGILVFDYWTEPVLVFPILFTIPVVLSAWFCRPVLAYALAVLLPVGSFLIATFVETHDPVLVNASNGLIRIMVLCLVAFLVARTARAERQLKVLHGLLPICMFCKRILDEHERWQRLETYIAQHSEAEFTHGVCPECAKERYGELLNKNHPARQGTQGEHASREP